MWGYTFETIIALTPTIYAGIFERYTDFPYVATHPGLWS